MKPVSTDDIHQAASRLLQGEIVAFATETVYGLGASAHSESGVRQIYQCKGRPAGHPLIVHVSNLATACYWGEMGPMGVALTTAFWPGPMTLIVPRRADVPAHACGDESTIGLRCPSHPLAQSLMQQFEVLGGRGIAAPSANRFGGVSPTTAAHVLADFGGDLTVLDGGPCTVGLESTIVDVSAGFARMLRPGSISEEQINDALAAHGFDCLAFESAADPDQGSDNKRKPRVSGSMAAHYAPTTRLELVHSDRLAARLDSLRQAGKRVACCAFEPVQKSVGKFELTSADPNSYGVRLYAMLREFDQADVDIILIEQPPRAAAWHAVNDRLGRASTGSGPTSKEAN